jgi:lipopolysaccharide transport system ATP-binding protein
MEYEVLKPGYKLQSSVGLYNEEGIHLFEAIDLDQTWRGRIRPPGRYRSTAWIPGNYLAEGIMFVNVDLSTSEPWIVQSIELQVIDSCDGDSARGDWAGQLPGVVRPMLTWTTAVLH